jgi:NADPH:quinone reductase-like Zn-dependent oxidoreductase
MLPLDQAFVQAAASELFELVERGTLRPLVGSVHALPDGAAALREIESRAAIGKPVLRVRD